MTRLVWGDDNEATYHAGLVRCCDGNRSLSGVLNLVCEEYENCDSGQVVLLLSARCSSHSIPPHLFLRIYSVLCVPVFLLSLTPNTYAFPSSSLASQTLSFVVMILSVQMNCLYDGGHGFPTWSTEVELVQHLSHLSHPPCMA